MTQGRKTLLSPEPGHPEHGQRYTLGIAIVLAGGLCLSFGGLILRHIEEANVWQVIFFRFVFMILLLLAYLALRYGRRLPGAFGATGWGGVVIMVSFGGGSVLYVLALSLTTVANAMFVLSAAPIVTAVLGWFVLGERVRRVTWVTMAAASAGILIMVAAGLGAGRLGGNLAALGTVLSFAIMLTVIRRSKAVDMVPATCLGGIFGAVIAAAFTGGDLAISAHDLAFCLLMGMGQMGAGFLLITIGTRFVPAAEVALLALVEVVLAPIWVWLWVNEVPAGGTLIGGAIVFTAVLVQLVHRLRQERDPASRLVSPKSPD